MWLRDRDMEHDAYKAVTIEIAEAIMRSTVKKLVAGLEFSTKLFHHSVINGE